MTTLAKDSPRTYELGDIQEYGVIASDIIYEGAMVGLNGSGHARPLVADDPFAGFAIAKADNSTGAAAAINVRVQKRGAVKFSISGLAITDVGKDVFASDDDVMTLTQGTNTRIGYVERFISTGVGVVAFQAVNGVLTELTDSSGGTASDTLAAISGTYVQSEVRNSIASLAAKITALTRRLGN